MRKRKAAAKSKSRSSAKTSRRPSTAKWSAAVAKRSDALDLKPGIFKSRSARSIALSLKHSADQSHRRKAGPFQSAMSKLNFEINRAGHNLSANQRKTLDQAKVELRRVYGRAPS